MLERVIGVGEYIISNNVDDVLKIYGLASCIGMVMYCPNIKVLAMGHFLLPTADINPELSLISPAYFVDTGIVVMVDNICRDYCYNKENIVVSIYGGAESRVEGDVFNMGNRNVQSVKAKMDEYHMRISYSATGGKVSRTLEVDVETGAAKLRLQPTHII